MKQVLPSLFAEFTAELRLHLLPCRQRTLELRFSGFRQAQTSLSAVVSAALGNPTLPPHDRQGARQRCAVHGEHFTEAALRHFACEREQLEDRKLRDA